jgi:ACT domain-containing protein
VSGKLHGYLRIAQTVVGTVALDRPKMANFHRTTRTTGAVVPTLYTLHFISGGQTMRAIVTVIGKDRVGIIANVCTLLAQSGVNILDISQTILQEYLTMIMLVDTSGCVVPFAELSKSLETRGEEQELSIRIQREDIFEAMHRI